MSMECTFVTCNVSRKKKTDISGGMFCQTDWMYNATHLIRYRIEDLGDPSTDSVTRFELNLFNPSDDVFSSGRSGSAVMVSGVLDGEF